MIKNAPETQIHLMTVPNNMKGNNIIQNLRERMKQSDSPCRVVLYGRGKGKGTKSNFPLTKARSVAIYLVAREPRLTY